MWRCVKLARAQSQAPRASIPLLYEILTTAKKEASDPQSISGFISAGHEKRSREILVSLNSRKHNTRG
jgi:hypothetical protein